MSRKSTRREYINSQILIKQMHENKFIRGRVSDRIMLIASRFVCKMNARIDIVLFIMTIPRASIIVMCTTS